MESLNTGAIDLNKINSAWVDNELAKREEQEERDAIQDDYDSSVAIVVTAEIVEEVDSITVDLVEEPKFKPTNDQAKFLDGFLYFIQDPIENMAVLSGSAGAGKTVSIIHAIKLALECGYHTIGVCAPTHKAVRILTAKLDEAELPLNWAVWDLVPQSNEDGSLAASCREIDESIGKANDRPLQVYVGTLHQFISARPLDQSDPEDDNAEFGSTKGYNEQPVSYVDMLICDEASMIGEAFFENIRMASEFAANKILFVGDEFQLYPIEKGSNPKRSPVFDLTTRWNLREVVRYDGRILQLATRIRESMEFEENYKPYDFQAQEACDITVIKNRKGYKDSSWLEAIVKSAKQANADRNSNPDWMRVLVFKRKTMEEINQIIRESLYGDSASDHYFEGESVFTHGSCSSYVPLDTRLEAISEDGKLDIERLGNSRDFQIRSARLDSELIPCPLPSHADTFPVLYQPFNRVELRGKTEEKSSKYLEFALLTSSQVVTYTANRQALLDWAQPIIDDLDSQIFNSKIGRNKDGSVRKSMNKDRQVLTKFIKHFSYCYNVAEEKIFAKTDADVKPEDKDLVTTEKSDRGYTVRKKACASYSLHGVFHFTKVREVLSITFFYIITIVLVLVGIQILNREWINCIDCFILA